MVEMFRWCDICVHCSTRPFLSVMEKKWIVFQLLKVLEECQSKRVSIAMIPGSFSSCRVSGKEPSYLAKVEMHVISTSPQVYHGDIKTENILLTGWDWYVPCGNDSSFCIWLHFPSEPCKVEMLSRTA